MDHTPNKNDSGFINSSSVKRDLFASCASTPCSIKSNSRKRKLLRKHVSATLTSLPVRKLSNILEDQERSLTVFKPIKTVENTLDYSMNESCFSEYSFFDDFKSCNSTKNISFSEISFSKGNFERSSPVINTCDDFKLSTSLEKCSLDDFDFKYESHVNAKKCKWDNEELECSKKSNSAPGTPLRSETDFDCYLRKFHSLEFTPTKIGTPERNEILYPQLVEVKPAVKPKSPSKFKNDIRRVSKPARKRLFPCKDFVHLFTNLTNIDSVIHKIFSFLDDSDLVNVAKVSKLWKKALACDKEAYKRYRLYVKNVVISKENLYFDSVLKTELSTGNFSIINKSNSQITEIRSPPTSPARENWKKFTKMAAQLKSSQRLTKCLICCFPAVIEKSVAQCTKGNCSYLWCIKCMSGSKTGSADFNCTCSGNRSPRSPLNDRSGLSDISNIDGSASYYFTEENLYNKSANFTSGYYSQSDIDISPIVYQNIEQKSKIKNTVLTDCNKNFTSEKRPIVGSNNTSILEHSAAIQRARKNLSRRKDITEPTSPQKIKIHALGSKQSKRNLRRLCL